VYPELTCRENLRFFGQMFGLDDLDSRVVRTLEDVGLNGRVDDQARTLSRGLLQRLNVARAILHEPAVLILDEPDTGLDAAGRAVLSGVIAGQVAAGGSVVLTTHALDYALELASRVVTLAQGRVALDAERSAVRIDDVRAAIELDGLPLMAGR
jgi:ABC-type multidrug transport system ATPase subunit